MNDHLSATKRTASKAHVRKKRYPFEGLMLTEIEIMIMDELVSYGLSDKETSDALGMKFYTFKTHMKRIFTKLDVNNRTAAVLEYLRLRGRLIDTPESTDNITHKPAI